VDARPEVTDTAGTPGPGADRACPHAPDDAPRPGDPHWVDELCALVLLALDRLEPLLARLREAARSDPGAAGTGSAGAGTTSGSCPLCLALESVRRERPGSAARLAEHGAAAVAALRDALATGPTAGPSPAPAPRRERPVEHILVERPGRRAARAVRHIPVDRRPAPGAAPGGAATC
jgi:hypothetical protein